MGQLLARVVDLDLLVDVVEDSLHLVLQAVQLMSLPLQLPLVFLIVLLQLWMGQTFHTQLTVRHRCKSLLSYRWTMVAAGGLLGQESR